MIRGSNAACTLPKVEAAHIVGKGRIAGHRAGRRNRSHEVRVIEEIERVRARLHAVSLIELEDPAESHVEVHRVGTAQRIVSEIAERAGRIRQ